MRAERLISRLSERECFRVSRGTKEKRWLVFRKRKPVCDRKQLGLASHKACVRLLDIGVLVCVGARSRARFNRLCACSQFTVVIFRWLTTSHSFCVRLHLHFRMFVAADSVKDLHVVLERLLVTNFFFKKGDFWGNAVLMGESYHWLMSSDSSSLLTGWWLIIPAGMLVNSKEQTPDDWPTLIIFFSNINKLTVVSTLKSRPDKAAKQMTPRGAKKSKNVADWCLIWANIPASHPSINCRTDIKMLGEAQPLAGRLIDWLTDWHRRLNAIHLAACQRPVYLLQANELKNKLGCDLKVFLNSTTRQIQRGDALQMNSLSSHFAFWVASNPIFTQYGTLLAGINPCLLKLWGVFFI